MYTLFVRIILSNWRSILVLFVVLVFSGTSFLTLREITTNVDAFVTSKTKPLFGADIRISSRGYASGDIFPMIAPLLQGEKYQIAERREFSTTLLDKDGKTGLLQVVAYSGSYPQRGILETKILSGVSEYDQRIAATPGIIDRFSSGGVLSLDGRKIALTHSILESSDLGFSLGTENHLLILPTELLAGSMLLSSGSRLDHDTLISFDDERRTLTVAASLKSVLPDNLYRVRTYEERTERNLDTVDTLTDYITLILLVSSIFAFIILRSAHEGFYANLAHTLRIVETLGLTRTRQQILLLFLYGAIFPLSFLISIGLSYMIIESIRQFPEASDFLFFWGAILPSLLLLILLVVMAWFPIWWKLGEENENRKVLHPFFKKLTFSKKLQLPTISNEGGSGKIGIKQRIGEFLKELLFSLTRFEIFLPLMLGMWVLFLLFSDWVFAIWVALGAGIFYLLFGYVLAKCYDVLFFLGRNLRTNYFYIYDALRSLVRPLTPTIPVTVSLVSITVFFLVFASFSLAFRSKLIVDSTNTANIYAINILEEDAPKIRKIIGSDALLFDILRARVVEINGKSLESHFETDRVSGEFTREFNITTTPLENKILSGKDEIGRGEVSVDDDFRERLGVKIGDRITFLLSGREITLTVANIRESIREGFRPFFYFSFNQDEFKNAPRTYFVAEYASDVEAWKKQVLESSGPHVTFIDIESVLAIVRDISSKVLSIIGLFFAIVFLFAIGAIFAFFGRLRPIEKQKKRLYDLFGAKLGDVLVSIRGTRGALFGISYGLSIIIGGILSYFVLSSGGFFSFSPFQFFIISTITLGVYVVLFLIQRK